MRLQQRLKRIEEKLAERDSQGALRVVFRDPDNPEQEPIDAGNPNDIVVIFTMPRPNQAVV